jgi:protocatechuate 3,4-dioxygenase alpha subunit
MSQELPYLKETPSQTAGPYVHIGLAPGAAGFSIYRQELGLDIAGPEAAGERILLTGRIYDAMDLPIKDALLEFWQANAKGLYADSGQAGEVEEGFRGWGRAITDFESGEWRMETIKPGGVAEPGVRAAAPQISLWIVARGINIGLNTRLYFSDEAQANAADPLLTALPPERRETLIARRGEGEGVVRYTFDIRIGGEGETVFLDI